MAIIYIDNFRGFDDTYLSLADVNFFVGENSTGKTSLLKLIRNLSNLEFWITQEFNSEETPLGYYSEIVNLRSRKKFFQVGMLSDRFPDKENISAIKFKYINENDLPKLHEVNYISDNVNIQAIIENEHIRYRYNVINAKEIDTDNKSYFFRDWIQKDTLKNKSFKKIETDTSFYKRPVFMNLQSIILNEIENSKTDLEKEQISFRIPRFLDNMAWIAPIRTEPKKTYDSYTVNFNPAGTHTPYLLKNMVGKNASEKQKEKSLSILKRFGQDSGLFDNINVKPLGKSDTSPFEIHISLNGNFLKITNVGYGVSQILPLVIEIIARNKGSWFAIQQPEVHLHPRAQAAFGDFIFKAFENEKKKFIIETHSDYIIDRFRIRLNRNSQSDDINIKSQIVFFRRSDKGNSLVQIPINNDGSLNEDQPKEYTDFFIKEQLNLIQL